MKPYQKPPMEAAVLPATEMMQRPQRPPLIGARGPPPIYKNSRQQNLQLHAGPPNLTYNPVPAPRTGPMAGKLAKPMARYHPSLSGSETDVSTSTENLTQEEKFVLRHMERQEPQGEENGELNTNVPTMPMSAAMELQMHLQQQRGLRPPSRPPMTSLDSHNMFPSLPRSLHEELISQQHAKLRGLVPSSSPMLSPMIGGIPPGTDMSKLTPSVYSHPTQVQDPVLNTTRSRNNPLEMTSSGAFFDHKAASSNLKGSSENNSSTDIIAKLTKEMLLSSADSVSTSASSTLAPTLTTTSPQSIINKLNLSPAKTNTAAKDLSNADKDLAALKSSLAAKKAAAQTTRLSLVGTNLDPNNVEGPELSRSQPDLFTGIIEQSPQQTQQEKNNPVYANTSDILQQRSEPPPPTMSATDLHQMETLKAENDRLRGQLNDYSKKIGRVSSLEQEMAKIHQAYQSLLKHSEKREMLEKSARAKLQGVIINLSDANKEVTERHEAVMGQLMSGEAKNQNIPGLDAILRGEILRKDGLIRQLMDQNKMLLTHKERHEVEMVAFNETLEEQRAHIQFLGSALSNAEGNVVRLEEENRLKEGYVERVKQMTRSLDQLQKASEKREAMEKKLRAKLEEELKELREAQKGNGDANLRPGDSIEELRRKLSEAEEKYIRLESERTQWEQRYLEETAMRQVAIDAASIPKDAKIAALEKTSAESEKLIADARNDKMKQFEEMQNAQRKCAEMETAIKTLETSLAEREAAIRILQSSKSSNLNVNNIEEFIAAAKMSMATPQSNPPPEHPFNSPHKKHQLSNVLATPPQYHSLNLSKKLGHAHRSLTPSAEMFLRGPNPNAEFIRSVTPSADILRAAPGNAELLRATPTNAEFLRAAQNELLRATPTSAELHRLSAPADMLRATPTSIEMLRATPTSIEMLRGTPTSVNAEMLRNTPGSHPPPASMADILRATPNFDIMRATPSSSNTTVEASLKRREPSGTSADAFQHPGPTLISTADLFNPSLVGGTMPKMSMLREHKSPLSNKLHQGGAASNSNANVSGNSSNFFDDSIGSFLGPPASSSTASSSNIRHEATKSYDGSKSYMEVWRV